MRCGLVVAGKVEQVGDQLVELAGLLSCRPHQRGRLRVGQAGTVLEQVQVRRQAGQRGAQLVRCVGDELALRGDRFVQRGQHGVEGRSAPAHLIVGPIIVAPGGAETGGEVTGLGDALGGRGEFGDGSEDAACGQPCGAVGYACGRDGEPGEKASAQLGERERLDQIVVGARVQAGDAVIDQVAGGEHQDRRPVAAGTKPPAHLETVRLAHGHVEHNRVDARCCHVGERDPATVGGQHLIPVAPQRGGKRLAHGRVVIDNEDPHLIHYARGLRTPALLTYRPRFAWLLAWPHPGRRPAGQGSRRDRGRSRRTPGWRGRRRPCRSRRRAD